MNIFVISLWKNVVGTHEKCLSMALLILIIYVLKERYEKCQHFLAEDPALSWSCDLPYLDRLDHSAYYSETNLSHSIWWNTHRLCIHITDMLNICIKKSHGEKLFLTKNKTNQKKKNKKKNMHGEIKISHSICWNKKQEKKNQKKPQWLPCRGYLKKTMLIDISCCRLVLRCRQDARTKFAKMRSDVLVKMELLDQKHGK